LREKAGLCGNVALWLSPNIARRFSRFVGKVFVDGCLFGKRGLEFFEGVLVAAAIFSIGQGPGRPTSRAAGESSNL